MGTQASDLRDQPPFASGHSSDIQKLDLDKFRQLFQIGVQLQSESKWDSAAAYFESATTIDSTYADAHYRLAQCLDTTNRKFDALRQYTLARDYDELRFRTDSQFNDLIRSMADNKYCFVADVVKALKRASPDSLTGHNFIWEHLHPNSRGAFLVAKCYAGVMKNHGILVPESEWVHADTLSDSAIWNDQRVTTIDERMAEYSVKWLTSGWPFKDQAPHISPVSDADTLDWIAEEAVAERVSWLQAHVLATEFYRHRGDLTEVADIYRSLLAESPLDLTLHSELADTYLQENKPGRAFRVLLQSVGIHPTLDGYMKLGDIMMRLSNPDSALSYYKSAYDFAQSSEERLRDGMAISYAYARVGNYQSARSIVVQLLQEFPNFQPAERLLQDINQIIAQTKSKK